jgi:hypothetical protein
MKKLIDVFLCILVILGHIVVIGTFLLCSICLWLRTYIFYDSDSENIVKVVLE